MSGRVSVARSAPPRRQPFRVTVRVLVWVLVSVSLLLGGLLIWGLVDAGRTKPEFPLLAVQPDSSLQGTVVFWRTVRAA